MTRTERPGYYGDGDCLWLQVSPGGTKSWIFRFTRNGQRKEMGLGPLRSVDLDWATVSQLREGDNPARWRGHLDQLLLKPTRIAPVKNFAALPWKEVPGVHAQAANARRNGGARWNSPSSLLHDREN